jgi:hypothetical protein
MLPPFDQSLEIARRAPSIHAWYLLEDALAPLAVEQRGDRDAIAALDAALESWPDELRVAPARWMVPLYPGPRSRSFDDDDCPLLLLARRLDFATGRMPTDPNRLARLVALPSVARITSIRVTGPGDLPHVDAEGNVAAIAAGELPALRELDLLGTRSRSGPLALLAGTRVAAALESLRVELAQVADLDRLVGGGFDRLRHLELGAWSIEAGLGVEGARKLAAWPVARQLESLALVGCALTGEGLAALATSLVEVRRIRIRDDRLSPVAAEAIARLPRLTALELDRYQVDPEHRDATWAALLAAPGLEEVVDASGGPPDGEAATGVLSPRRRIVKFSHGSSAAMTRMAASPAGALEVLDVPWSSLETAGLKALASAAWLPDLRELGLAHCRGSGPGWKALLGTPRFARLRVLDLSHIALSDKMVAYLASPAFDGLERLVLDETKLASASALALLDMPLFRSLRELSLVQARIGDDWLQALARLPGAIPLRRLDLRNSGKVTSAGIAAIAASPVLASLEELDLSGSQADAAAAEALATGRLVRLHTLRLDDCEIGDRGATALATGAGTANLRELSVGRAGIGRDGASALTGHPRLVRLDLRRNPIAPNPSDGQVYLSAGRLESLGLRHIKAIDADVMETLFHSDLDGIYRYW